MATKKRPRDSFYIEIDSKRHAIGTCTKATKTKLKLPNVPDKPKGSNIEKGKNGDKRIITVKGNNGKKKFTYKRIKPVSTQQKATKIVMLPIKKGRNATTQKFMSFSVPLQLNDADISHFLHKQKINNLLEPIKGEYAFKTKLGEWTPILDKSGKK